MVDETEAPDPTQGAAAERLRRAIRQRRAVLAAAEAAVEGGGLADLEELRLLEEPPTTSARPLVGRALTLWRKLVKHLALAWYLRPILGQQNDFNRAAARRIGELTAAVERLERRLAALEGRNPGDRAP